MSPIILLLLLYGSAVSATELPTFLHPGGGFYSKTCPFAEILVRGFLVQAMDREPRSAASVLSLQFQDCFVNGCDGSLLLDDTAGLRSYEVIDKMKEALEKACPAVVSCADIIIMAARDAVLLSGGPYWEVKLGRLDSLTTASKEGSDDDIMRADVGLLITLFSRFNLSIKDLVALSGSHSIGSKGRFDNRYYKDLVDDGKGLFTHDETRGYVEMYSQNQDLFFQDFVEGMLKLGDLKGHEGGGEIRRNCRMVNGSPGYLRHTEDL